jgi:hypothetical protein
VIQALEAKPASLFIIRSMFGFLRRKSKPKAFWLSLEPTVTLPSCPLHGADCGTVANPFGPGRLVDYRPCEVWQAAIERAEWRERYEHYWNPATEEWTILER